MVQAYTEVLQVVDGELVAEEMDESILKHASVAVAAVMSVSVAVPVFPYLPTPRRAGTSKAILRHVARCPAEMHGMPCRSCRVVADRSTCVCRKRAMGRGYVREDKAVAVDPFGVLGVEGHELVEQDVGDRGHAHRGARMARVGLECGIDLEKSSHISELVYRMRLCCKKIAWWGSAGWPWWGKGRGEGGQSADVPRGCGWC